MWLSVKLQFVQIEVLSYRQDNGKYSHLFICDSKLFNLTGYLPIPLQRCQTRINCTVKVRGGFCLLARCIQTSADPDERRRISNDLATRYVGGIGNG